MTVYGSRSGSPDRAPPLRRQRQGRLLAGVCVGLAARYNLDLTLVRLAALLLALASGIGLLLYLAGWLLIPAEDLPVSADPALRDVVRANLSGVEQKLRDWAAWAAELWRARADLARRSPAPVNRRWLAHLLITGGALLFLYSIGVFAWLGTTRSLGLAIVAIGVAVLASNASALRRQGDQDTHR